MDRPAIIAQLEEYWHKQQAKYPDEPMDIPSAVAYYWHLPMDLLLQEYNEYLG